MRLASPDLANYMHFSCAVISISRPAPHFPRASLVAAGVSPVCRTKLGNVQTDHANWPARLRPPPIGRKADGRLPIGPYLAGGAQSNTYSLKIQGAPNLTRVL